MAMLNNQMVIYILSWSNGQIHPKNRQLRWKVSIVESTRFADSTVGGWYAYPSEKWWSSSVGIMTFPICRNIKHNNICSKPPTSTCKTSSASIGLNTQSFWRSTSDLSIVKPFGWNGTLKGMDSKLQSSCLQSNTNHRKYVRDVHCFRLCPMTNVNSKNHPTSLRRPGDPPRTPVDPVLFSNPPCPALNIPASLHRRFRKVSLKGLAAGLVPSLVSPTKDHRFQEWLKIIGRPKEWMV